MNDGIFSKIGSFLGIVWSYIVAGRDFFWKAIRFTFATGIQGKLDKTWAWPVAQVTQILKLIETNTCEMAFSDDGALQIKLDSGIGKYQYILPAQSK